MKEKACKEQLHGQNKMVSNRESLLQAMTGVKFSSILGRKVNKESDGRPRDVVKSSRYGTRVMQIEQTAESVHRHRERDGCILTIHLAALPERAIVRRFEYCCTLLYRVVGSIREVDTKVIGLSILLDQVWNIGRLDSVEIIYGKDVLLLLSLVQAPRPLPQVFLSICRYLDSSR